MCVCVFIRPPALTKGIFIHGGCVFCCEDEEEHKCEGIHDLHYSVHEEKVYLCVCGSVYVCVSVFMYSPCVCPPKLVEC